MSLDSHLLLIFDVIILLDALITAAVRRTLHHLEVNLVVILFRVHHGGGFKVSRVEDTIVDRSRHITTICLMLLFDKGF